MKKLTRKQLDVLCECGHRRGEHADDIEGDGTVLREAVGFCLVVKRSGHNCECQEFKKQKYEKLNKGRNL